MANKNMLLTIEKEALYGLPDFSDVHRLKFLALDKVPNWRWPMIVREFIFKFIASSR
ncbi:hypothetical protein Q3H59_004267 [Pantoea sp. SORGH_AS 659]|nr:hypothetical protein [Pantoea sp. SORGH_AS_0659]